MVKTRAIRLRVIEGPNVRNEHSIHSKWKSKRMQATYMRRMRNNNLYIRIACLSHRPQLALISAHVSEVRRLERAQEKSSLAWITCRRG